MLAALAFAATFTAPVELPDYQPGDAFVFSDGRVERVIADNGKTRRVTWGGLSGPSYRRNRNFIVPVVKWRSGRGSGKREVRGNPDALWPISKAKSARFRVITETQANPQASFKRSVSLWVCSTAKPRRFTVPAGTFDTIPVKCERYSTTAMRLLEQREWDYAPELGHYVRRVAVNYLRGTRRTAELVAALSGPAATKSRLAALARQARRAGRANTP